MSEEINVLALVEQLAQLEDEMKEYTDCEEGPWFYLDGRPWVAGPSCFPAPEHHPRRCHARGKNSGRRCQRFAIRGAMTCQFHGGRTGGKNNKHTMPSVYAKHLMPSLAQRLADFYQSKERSEALELYDEIALARTLLTQALDTLTLLETQPPGAVQMEHLIAARQMVRANMELVAELVSKMARVERDMNDKVGVGALGLFINDVTRLIFRRLGDDSETAKLLADDLLQAKVPYLEHGVGEKCRVVEVGL